MGGWASKNDVKTLALEVEKIKLDSKKLEDQNNLDLSVQNAKIREKELAIDLAKIQFDSKKLEEDNKNRYLTAQTAIINRCIELNLSIEDTSLVLSLSALVLKKEHDDKDKELWLLIMKCISERGLKVSDLGLSEVNNM